MIVMALVLAYGLLSWVQYEYYGRVLNLRTEAIRSQMKEAMSEVAEELQVRELIRYLNRGLQRENDRFKDGVFLPISRIYIHLTAISSSIYMIATTRIAYRRW